MSCVPRAPHAHEQLFKEHRTLALRIASRAGRGRAAEDRDELMSAAFLGLLEAIRRYDPERGVPFVAYAGPRIGGAIRDHVRALSGRSRRASDLRRDLAWAESQLGSRYGRPPTDHELARFIGTDLAELQRMRHQSQPIRVLSLEHSDPGQAPLADRILGPGADPSVCAGQRARDRAVREACRRLPRRERRVVELCFFRDLSLREAGSQLGLSGARIHQIRVRALERLRDWLEPYRDWDPTESERPCVNIPGGDPNWAATAMG